jgi:hypothetical protein
MWGATAIDLSSLPEGEYTVGVYFATKNYGTNIATSDTFQVDHVLVVQGTRTGYDPKSHTLDVSNIEAVFSGPTGTQTVSLVTMNVLSHGGSRSLDITGKAEQVGGKWQALDIDVSKALPEGDDYYVESMFERGGESSTSASENFNIRQHNGHPGG